MTSGVYPVGSENRTGTDLTGEALNLEPFAIHPATSNQ